MNSPAPIPSRAAPPFRSRDKGSLIITTMLIAVVLGLGLTSYIALSRNSLRMAQRTFYLNDATNLAEAGIEQAMYSFQLMSSGTSAATAWTGWTPTGTGLNDAKRTLTFNRSQNAVGTVKIFVNGYNGSDSDPYVIAQATITPFDGTPPVVKVIQINIGKNAYWTNGLVGVNSLTVTGNTTQTGNIVMKSYNSLASSATVHAKFTTDSQLTSLSSLVVKDSSLTVASPNSTISISGDLYRGTNITSTPSTVTVSGNTYTDYIGVFPSPTQPLGTASSSSKRRTRTSGAGITYNTGYSSTLPNSSDTINSNDSTYYYYWSNRDITDLAISTGKTVIIVGTNNTKINLNGSSDVITVGANSTLTMYIDGNINIASRSTLTADWAGALKVYTTNTTTSTINANSTVYAGIYAPNATLTFVGNTTATANYSTTLGQADGRTLVGAFVGKNVTATNKVRLVWDSALLTENLGRIWPINQWWDMGDNAARTTIGALTGNFLP